MYAYPNSHIVIGIIAYGSPVGLDLDIRALSSKQRLASETWSEAICSALVLGWL